MTTHIGFRKATYDDLPAIMQIVDEAKALLKADGSSQWQSGYPNKFTFIADIDAGASYVLTVDDKVAATAMISSKEESGYSALKEGQWQFPESEYGSYAVIHRVAVSQDYRGQHLIDHLFKNLFRTISALGYKTVRIDTHTMNARMQKAIDRSGMTLSGVVTLDHDPIEPTRLCYEGLLENLDF